MPTFTRKSFGMIKLLKKIDLGPNVKSSVRGKDCFCL